MSQLIHLIYSSVATVPFSTQDLHHLLEVSRRNNQANNITGMLLFDHGSFFQVLEGQEDDVNATFARIQQDPRHEKVVTIIQEPIFRRAFEEWTMGHAEVTADEIVEIIGLNNFFSEGTTFDGVGPGRAKKLLNAFREGSWRGKLNNEHKSPTARASKSGAKAAAEELQIAFQPILSATGEETLAKEAVAFSNASNSPIPDEILFTRFKRNASANDFYTRSINEAAAHDPSQVYSLNFFGNNLPNANASMQQIIDEIEKRGMHPSQFIIEIHQNHLIGSPNAFGDLLQTYRAKGLRFLIDHFGAGRAGLNLLEPYRPDLIALNKYLVMGVHTNGPRQAIVKGLLQTCKELAIDVVAKFVIDLDEYEWLKEAGVDYVQGNLFGEPTTNNPTQATNDNE